MSGRERRLSDERALLVRMTGEFARAEITPRAEEMDEHPENNDIMKIMAETAEFGMLAAMLPEEQGGQGLDLYSFLLALVEISRESAAVAALGLAHNLACKALALAGLELPESGPGRTDLLCLGLPARVEEGGAGSVVSGGCDFVPGLFLARRAVLVSREGEVAEVELEGAGVTAAPGFDHGLRAARPGTLELGMADVLQHSRLEKEASDYLLAALCLGATAIATGIAAKAAEVSRAYARERYQGGTLIAEHQQLRLMMGGMRAAEEAGLALLEGSCGEGGDQPLLSAALAAKALVCERAFEAACDAVQLHGGYGYMRDYGMERLMRDASYLRVWPFTGAEALLTLTGD